MKFDFSVMLVLAVANYAAGYGLNERFSINIVAVVLGLFFIEYYIYLYLFKQYKKVNDRMYYFGAWEMGSYPNFYAQTEGNRWTKSIIVKREMKNGDLFLDNFRFDWSVKKFFKMFSLKKRFENFECRANSQDFIKSAVVIGAMGSGKTEFYNSIISQNRFNRYLINDIKGDFTQKFYNPRKDIILNPYDRRGSIWNPFEEAKESDFVVEVFLENLFNSIAGDKKDFFSASTKDRYMSLFNEINYKKTSLSSSEKLNMYVEELNKYFNEARVSGRTSEADVASTMKLVFEFFEYLNFCVQSGVRTFTIKEFLASDNKKLFLLLREDQKSKLIPFFTGFLAAFVAILLSQKDNKENLTGLILDEYLSFAKSFDENTLEHLHTQIRSKGGCLISGIQFLPEKDNKKIAQNILNSARYWFLFEIIDNFTLRKINETIGKVRYKKESIDRRHKSYKIEESELINTAIMQSLGKRFEHITFIPSKKILYKGYTPLVKLKNKNENFMKSENIREFYRSR